MMSGLTVGFLSIDSLVLELLAKTGTPQEKEYAKRLQPILSNRHWLLVTLLLCNALALETLPIYLHKMMNETMSIICAVFLVLVMGEIIPQAYCTGPDQIKIASSLCGIVDILMKVTSPFSYPIALSIDYLLGVHGVTRFDNEELKALIKLHTKETIKKVGDGEHARDNMLMGSIGIRPELANIMEALVNSSETKAKELLIKLDKVFTIDFDEVITKELLDKIIDNGFSRIPVTINNNKEDIIGILRSKQLIGLNFKNPKSMKEHRLNLSRPIVVSPDLPLVDLLKEFGEGKSHMAFLSNSVNKLQSKLGLNAQNSVVADSMMNENYSETVRILGIVTLEDVIEKLINIDIKDEDEYVNDQENNLVTVRISD